MFAMAALMLAGGAKGFFEDPAYLIGIPLLALGALGMVIVFTLIGIAGRSRAGTDGTPEAGRKVSSRRREEGRKS